MAQVCIYDLLLLGAVLVLTNKVTVGDLCCIWKNLEWVIVVQLRLGNFSTTSMQNQVNFQWNYAEVHFVLRQHA